MCDSIVNDGFLFPLAVRKLGDKNYVIDGECSYYALQELEYRGFEIPAVPIFYVRTSEKTKSLGRKQERQKMENEY